MEHLRRCLPFTPPYSPFGEVHTRTQVGSDDDGSPSTRWLTGRMAGRPAMVKTRRPTDTLASRPRFVSSQLAEPVRPVRHAFMASPGHGCAGDKVPPRCSVRLSRFWGQRISEL